jgi:hypothetical protein
VKARWNWSPEMANVAKTTIEFFFFFFKWPYIVQDLCKEICKNMDPKEQEKKILKKKKITRLLWC